VAGTHFSVSPDIVSDFNFFLAIPKAKIFITAAGRIVDRLEKYQRFFCLPFFERISLSKTCRCAESRHVECGPVC